MAATFDDLYYLERACMLQVLAMGTGRPLRIVPENIAAKTGRQMNGESQQAELHLEALKRMLDRDEPGWSTIGLEGKFHGIRHQQGSAAILSGTPRSSCAKSAM